MDTPDSHGSPFSPLPQLCSVLPQGRYHIPAPALRWRGAALQRQWVQIHSALPTSCLPVPDNSSVSAKTLCSPAEPSAYFTPSIPLQMSRKISCHLEKNILVELLCFLWEGLEREIFAHSPSGTINIAFPSLHPGHSEARPSTTTGMRGCNVQHGPDTRQPCPTRARQSASKKPSPGTCMNAEPPSSLKHGRLRRVGDGKLLSRECLAALGNRPFQN